VDIFKQLLKKFFKIRETKVLKTKLATVGFVGEFSAFSQKKRERKITVFKVFLSKKNK